MLNAVDVLIDPSEISQDQKKSLFKELEFESRVQQVLLWYQIKTENIDQEILKSILGPEIIKDVVLTTSLELGLFFRYIEGYFGIRFKAALTKTIMNDKYFFLLNPLLRNFEPDDASGPILKLTCYGDLRTYSLELLDVLPSALKNPDFLNNAIINADHVFEYTRTLLPNQSGMIGLLLCKALTEALDKSSIAIGSVWVDKAMTLATEANM